MCCGRYLQCSEFRQTAADMSCAGGNSVEFALLRRVVRAGILFDRLINHFLVFIGMPSVFDLDRCLVTEAFLGHSGRIRHWRRHIRYIQILLWHNKRNICRFLNLIVFSRKIKHRSKLSFIVIFRKTVSIRHSVRISRFYRVAV